MPWYDSSSQRPGESKIRILKPKTKPHRPKLGQHFLHDAGYRNRIIEELALSADDVVIEIGPGQGAITDLLAGRARKVIALEVDPALAQQLETDCKARPNVRIILADVLRVNFAALCREEGIAQGVIVGNLPYYITSPILHHLFAQRQSIRSMGLLMQREVAERLAAAPGGRDYGYLSVATQLFSKPYIAFGVPPGAFSPAPKVQSALVTLAMKPRFPEWQTQRTDEFLEFVKCCFAQKRKNLLNNLGGRYLRTRLLEAFAAAGKSATSRAEEFSVEDFAAVFENLRRDGT